MGAARRIAVFCVGNKLMLDDGVGPAVATASLHDLKLVDLFDAAALLGYEAEGLCLGMQVENPSPAVVTVGLTPKVDAALPLLVETVAGELARLGSPLRARA